MDIYIVDHFISNEESLNVKRPTWNEGHLPWSKRMMDRRMEKKGDREKNSLQKSFLPAQNAKATKEAIEKGERQFSQSVNAVVVGYAISFSIRLLHFNLFVTKGVGSFNQESESICLFVHF
jgi:hypothetical protein